MGGSDEVRDGDLADGVGDGFDVLNYINFRWDVVSPSEMSGRFIVKPKTSQVSRQFYSHDLAVSD